MRHGQPQAPRIGQQAHDDDRHRRAEHQVGDAAAEPCPRLVGERPDQRLHNHPHERGKDPEIAEVVRVGPERGENPAYVGTLEGVGYLYAEEAEAEVGQLTEGEVTLAVHGNMRFVAARPQGLACKFTFANVKRKGGMVKRGGEVRVAQTARY